MAVARVQDVAVERNVASSLCHSSVFSGYHKTDGQIRQDRVGNNERSAEKVPYFPPSQQVLAQLRRGLK